MVQTFTNNCILNFNRLPLQIAALSGFRSFSLLSTNTCYELLLKMYCLTKTKFLWLGKNCPTFQKLISRKIVFVRSVSNGVGTFETTGYWICRWWIQSLSCYAMFAHKFVRELDWRLSVIKYWRQLELITLICTSIDLILLNSFFRDSF